MFGLGIWELVLIFGIVLLLFGARRLPDIAAGLGGAVGAFKKSLREGNEAAARPPEQLPPASDPNKK